MGKYELLIFVYIYIYIYKYIDVLRDTLANSEKKIQINEHKQHF